MRIIKKVYKIKASDQLLITVPKDSGIKDGDYVEIKKVEATYKDKLASDQKPKT